MRNYQVRLKKQKKHDDFTTWVCLIDGILFDGSFDTSEEAVKHARHHNANYLGLCDVKPMTDNQFKEFMGITERVISDPELARGVGSLVNRHL